MAIKPFTFETEQQSSFSDIKFQTKQTPGNIMPDFTKKMPPIIMSNEVHDEQKKKRGPGRPRKNEPGQLFTSPSHMTVNPSIINTTGTDADEKRQLSIMETNEPFDNKYTETNNILRSSIAQIDHHLIDLNRDIEQIRNAKMLKNKYQYLSLLQGNLGSLISSKIAAAREINNTISKCNDFEMKRFKEIKASALADADDDQRVMEMYKAFVSTPVSTGQSPFPNINQMSVNPVQATSGMAIGNQDAQMQQYLTNLTPAQNMMYLGENPNVQQVVVYNQETGARYFEIMDMSTGQPVPNAEPHDAMFLEDVTIDLKNNIARNTNLGESYPLVVVGQSVLNEY